MTPIFHHRIGRPSAMSRMCRLACLTTAVCIALASPVRAQSGSESGGLASDFIVETGGFGIVSGGGVGFEGAGVGSARSDRVSARSQPGSADKELWAGLVKTRGYVVGSPLASSGAHRFEGDTTWAHIGWNIPRVSGLAYDPDDPAVLYLAAGNGALRSMDGGSTWRITTGWDVTEAQDIDVDPQAPDHVYVATAYGVWRSTDRAGTWTESTSALAEKYTQAVKVDRSRQGRILIATWGGIHLSEDDGATWRPVGPERAPVNDVQQSESNPAVWLAAMQDRGILLSEDGGQTWRVAHDADGRIVLAAAIDPFDANNMAAAAWGGVYVSTDGGATWTNRADGLPVAETYEVVFDAVEPGRLWVATVEHGIFYADSDTGAGADPSAPAPGWQYAGLNGALVFDMIFIDTATKK